VPVSPPLSPPPAQVSKCYPRSTAGFAPELMALLEAQHAVLDAALRRAMVQALILLRNRNQARRPLPACRSRAPRAGAPPAWCTYARAHGVQPTPAPCALPSVPRSSQLDPAVLLPLLFRLFRVNDKALRALLFRHIVAGAARRHSQAPPCRAPSPPKDQLCTLLCTLDGGPPLPPPPLPPCLPDLKASNQRARNERLNRSVQSFLYGVLQARARGGRLAPWGRSAACFPAATSVCV
jgi:hypothetical protein